MKLVAWIFDSYPRIQDSIRRIRLLFADENPELRGRIPRMASHALCSFRMGAIFARREAAWAWSGCPRNGSGGDARPK